MTLLDPDENAEWIAEVRRLIDLAAAGQMMARDASYEFFKQLKAAGYDAGAAKGTPDDLASEFRRNLIFDTNVALRQGHRHWVNGNDPDVLDGWPAAMLVKGVRDGLKTKWKDRWQEAGGQLIKGKMIALKTDPIWARVSWFGLPWEPMEPFRGVTIEEVDRDKAERAGLLSRASRPRPANNPDLPSAIFFLTALPPRADMAALLALHKRKRAEIARLSRA